MSFIDKRAIFLTACLAGAAALCACGSDSKTSDGGGSAADADSKSDTTGGDATGGNTSGGDATGGNTSGGNTSGGNTSGGNTSGGSATGGDACKGIDLQTSSKNCGECGNACGENSVCRDGTCVCDEDFEDCDNDGICENWGECICRPGETRPCYFGAEETLFEGSRCKAGVFECKKTSFGTYQWGNECVGMVLPSYDYVCDPDQPDLDLDCDGRPDAKQDSDGDGYAICNEAGDAISDCCDNANMCNTAHPELIHPGAIDCKGNNIDDNCDGIADDSEFACGQEVVVEADCKLKERSCSDLASWTYGLQDNVSAGGALALARALDACMDVVTAESGLPGLIEFTVSAASDYNIGLDARQINIKDGMYDAGQTKRISPREGGTFAILSSGIAGDARTELAAQGKEDKRFSLGGSIPEPYRTAHGNRLQTHPNCPSGGADIYDAVRLHLKIRAPETAKGFSFDFRFFSREYPYFVCSSYNDFFLSLLTDESGNPLPGVNADGNISFDKTGNPVSVNNAFFTTCANAPCNGNYKKPVGNQCPAMLTCAAENPEAAEADQIMSCGGNMCKDGSEELAAYYPEYYSGKADDPQTKFGGGTAWLTTQAPVVPGEIFNLDFYIWDTGDRVYDSTVILDNFQWKCSETTVGTDFADGGTVVN